MQNKAKREYGTQESTKLWAKSIRQNSKLFAVRADCLYRTVLKRFLAQGLFLIGGGLFFDERVSRILIAGEEIRRGLAAQIAIDALVVHEECTWDILGILVCFVGHIGVHPSEIPPLGQPSRDDSFAYPPSLKSPVALRDSTPTQSPDKDSKRLFIR